MGLEIVAWLAILGALFPVVLLVRYLPFNRQWLLAILPFTTACEMALAIGVLEHVLVRAHH